MRSKVGAALAAGVGVLVLGAVPLGAYPEPPAGVELDGACEGQLIEAHNAARATAGRTALREDPAFDNVPRSWSLRMATNRSLSHNPSYVSQIKAKVPSSTAWAENVATGQTPAAVMQAWMNSTPHRTNILSPAYQRVAIACGRDATGTIWATANFVGAPSAIPARRPAPFASAGDASARLRYWMLSAGPDATRIESDSARLLDGRDDAASFAVWLGRSTAHRDTVPAVTRLYYAAFLRHPDASGLTFWIRQHHGGLSLNTIANRMVASAEFEARYGDLTDPQYVDQVYLNVLGRPADDTGRAFWVGRLQSGWSRGRVLTGFSESSEYEAKTAADVLVSWAWIQLLNRAATPSERAMWSDDDLADIVTFLVDSSSMATRAGTHAY